MNVKEAALQVLRDAGGALSDHEISDRILAEGLWQTKGQEIANALAALREIAPAKGAIA